MLRKISNKWIVLLATVLFILCIGIVLFIGQYKWSHFLVNAVIDRDGSKVETLLKDTTKNPNFKGRCFEGHTKPLTRACLDPSYDALKILEMLINAGAKVEQEDYYCELSGVNKFSQKKIRFMLNTGVKPIVSSEVEYGNLLEVIAYTDTSYYDLYEMDEEEWEDLILEIYKLIYRNAKPFDKKIELKGSLDEAKERNNEPLIDFIQSELAKLE